MKKCKIKSRRLPRWKLMLLTYRHPYLGQTIISSVKCFVIKCLQMPKTAKTINLPPRGHPKYLLRRRGSYYRLFTLYVYAFRYHPYSEEWWRAGWSGREKMFPVINLLCPGTNGEISFRALTPDGGTFAKSSGYYYSPFRLTSEEHKKKKTGVYTF